MCLDASEVRRMSVGGAQGGIRDSALRALIFPRYRVALGVLLVCGGYYLGGIIGIVLRVNPGGISGIWLPHGVLVAALMLTPIRRWWLFIAALLPTHLHLVRTFQGPVPLSIMLIQFGGNISQAALGVVALRWWGGREPRLNDLRGMSAFILFAAFLAPCLVSAAVAWLFFANGWVGDFLIAWERRTLSVMCAAVIATPPIVLLAHGGLEAIRRAPQRRITEFGVLSAVLTAMLLASYGWNDVGSYQLWLMFVPLPLLLWSGVRFGPAGLGFHLFAAACVALHHAKAGGGPFAVGSATEKVVALHGSLLAFAVPLMILAALVMQHDRAIAALGQSRAQYRSVVEDQTELICRFLPDGTYTFVNAAYGRYFQQTPEELIGKSFWQFIPTEGHEEAREFLDSITPQHPVASREHAVVTPSGEVHWQQWTDRGFFDDAGRIIEYQAVGRDITERKRVEEQHRLLEAQRQVEAALRESERRKDEFLAMLGHELRNPLAPIGMAGEIVRTRAPGDSTMVWAGDVIRRQLGQLTRLVDDLLDISRITRGKIRLSLAPLDLRSVVLQAIETSRPLISAKNQALSIDVPKDPLPILGDGVRLAQVISNLLNNAVKYTDDRGRIALTVKREDAHVVLTVTDDGMGISSAMLERVFDMFMQVDGSREGGGGLGIGLTLVKRLLEMHDGTVEARSDGPGKGSQFIVRLPLALEESIKPAIPSQPGQRSERRATERKRILIVDDNVDAAESLAQLLKLDRHETLVVHDGLAALSAAERLKPDIVLLDIALPKLDGLAVARELRSRADEWSPLLVATTGFGQDEDRRRIAEAGFDFHLTKPLDPKMLQSLVRTGSLDDTTAE
jgi:PAS domain S-box-containing protein